jgi:hypothetical protein
MKSAGLSVPQVADHHSNASASFDEYTAYYDHALAQGVAVTGEDRNYYARCWIEWLRQCLDIPYLIELAGAVSVVGIDASERSLEVAPKSFDLRRCDSLAREKMCPMIRPGWYFATVSSIIMPPLIVQPRSSICTDV